jgi:hypothetical protein
VRKRMTGDPSNTSHLQWRLILDIQFVAASRLDMSPGSAKKVET